MIQTTHTEQQAGLSADETLKRVFMDIRTVDMSSETFAAYKDMQETLDRAEKARTLIEVPIPEPALGDLVTVAKLMEAASGLGERISRQLQGGERMTLREADDYALAINDGNAPEIKKRAATAINRIPPGLLSVESKREMQQQVTLALEALVEFNEAHKDTLLGLPRNPEPKMERQ